MEEEKRRTKYRETQVTEVLATVSVVQGLEKEKDE